MSQEKKFIKTIDKETAEKLLACGFQLVSKDQNIYTFLNQPPQNFNFEAIDKRTIVYDNTLCM